VKMINRQWRVAKPHDGAGLSLSREHFAYHEAHRPTPAEGEVLIHNVYFSCDPMNHAWVKGIPGRFDPIPVGSPMRGGVAGHIIVSRHPDFQVGEAVTGFLDWADFVTSPGIDYLGFPLQRVPSGFSLATGLATLGMTGLCAYFGMTDIGKPGPNDVVVVSGAAGAIGSIAGQIARIAGARTIGIAGGPRKCEYIVNELGYDAAIDYKAGDIVNRLSTACPHGINVFFDNVGGEVLDAALANMARRGRIIICGGMSSYGNSEYGIKNHIMLAIQGCVMSGFFYFDYINRFTEGIECLSLWLKEGRLKEVLDIAEGFDAVPDAALGQFKGANLGKQLVRIAEASME
jgi:NADPH-dependent curcumin reductase CurA